jgi:3-deoxy-D-manno-octulosonic-acid transferase
MICRIDPDFDPRSPSSICEPFMRQVYSILLTLLLPLILARLLWRSRRVPDYRRRWYERLAWFDRSLRPAAVWVHAVSVGEVQAAQPLIRHLLTADVGGVLVTTTTPTGAARLRALFADDVQHCHTPIDLPWIMGRFLGRVRPRLVLVMETEIWPNMLAACGQRRIPVILANARLSARSAGGYARVPRFTAETLARFDLIAAQSSDDAARFQALGVAPARIRTTGSIKFDLQVPASLVDGAEVMRRAWGSRRPVWVGASTHDGEDELLLTVQQQLRETFPNALLVLVPRHPERFDTVAALVQRSALPLVRRSAHDGCGGDCAVYLGDTMGELPMLMAAADCAFIGGSLVPVGGHNPLEAAAVGVPVVVGPETFNFAEITRRLIAEEGAARIADAAALAELLGRWLGDAAERARIGENGRRFVEANRGALDRLMALVDERLA